MIGYILLGSLVLVAYWLFAYKATHGQRVWLVSSFAVVVVIIAALGIGYELLTTGSVGAPPGLD